MEPASRPINIIKFTNARRQIIFVPSKHRTLLPVLQYLAAKFECARPYTEREATALLADWACGPDPDVLRRLLIDHHLLGRTINGARYWRKAFDETYIIR